MYSKYTQNIYILCLFSLPLSVYIYIYNYIYTIDWLFFPQASPQRFRCNEPAVTPKQVDHGISSRPAPTPRIHCQPCTLVYTLRKSNLSKRKRRAMLVGNRLLYDPNICFTLVLPGFFLGKKVWFYTTSRTVLVNILVILSFLEKRNSWDKTFWTWKWQVQFPLYRIL